MVTYTQINSTNTVTTNVQLNAETIYYGDLNTNAYIISDDRSSSSINTTKTTAVLGGGGEGSTNVGIGTVNGNDGKNAIFIESSGKIKDINNIGVLVGGGGGAVSKDSNSGNGGSGGGGGGGGNGGGVISGVYTPNGRSNQFGGGGGGFGGSGGGDSSGGGGDILTGGTSSRATTQNSIMKGGQGNNSGNGGNGSNYGGGGGSSKDESGSSTVGGGGAGGGNGNKSNIFSMVSGGGSGGGFGGISSIGQGGTIKAGNGGYGILNNGTINTLINYQGILTTVNNIPFGPLFYGGTGSLQNYYIGITNSTSYGQLYNTGVNEKNNMDFLFNIFSGSTYPTTPGYYIFYNVLVGTSGTSFNLRSYTSGLDTVTINSIQFYWQLVDNSSNTDNNFYTYNLILSSTITKFTTKQALGLSIHYVDLAFIFEPLNI
jgi:hypothetical protein